MSIATPPPELGTATLADLVEQLGGIPLNRIRSNPPPGTATEEDVLRSEIPKGLCCELIDGVLVEKTMGFFESMVAMNLGIALAQFVKKNDLGVVAGADGLLRILPKQIRMPDVCYVSWDRLPDQKLPQVRILDMAPDLAVEILSPGNTKGEMQRKLREYFESGVRLVWYVDPKPRTVTVYTNIEQSKTLTASDTLDGGEVLPGFELAIAQLFPQ